MIAAPMRSLRLRLGLGLAVVAILGALLLLALVALEYVVGAESPLGSQQLIHEVGDHVLAPLLVLLCLMGFAGYFVIEAAMRPLRRAAADLDKTLAVPRGVRFERSQFPSEAQPFVEAINRLLERLDAAAAAQEAFAADAAHELKTPLSVMALELDRLSGDTAAALRKDVGALSRLVDELLLLARLGAQAAAETPKEEVDLGAVSEDVVVALAPLALRDGRNLAFENMGAPSIAGRREAVAAAVRNLLENALRVTPVGGVVTIEAGPGARIVVRDEGPGIDERELARLSRRGVRADNASASGAGLGLAIVARIVAAHRGTLRTDPEARELVLDFSDEQAR